jgi:hypothetical protein
MGHHHCSISSTGMKGGLCCQAAASAGCNNRQMRLAIAPGQVQRTVIIQSPPDVSRA